VSGKNFRPREIRLKGARFVLAGIVWLYVLLAAIAPMVLIALSIALTVMVAVRRFLPSLHTVPDNPLQELLQSPRDAWLFAFVVLVAGGIREEIQRAFLLHRFERWLGGGTVGIICTSVALLMMTSADACNGNKQRAETPRMVLTKFTALSSSPWPADTPQNSINITLIGKAVAFGLIVELAGCWPFSLSARTADTPSLRVPRLQCAPQRQESTQSRKRRRREREAKLAAPRPAGSDGHPTTS